MTKGFAAAASMVAIGVPTDRQRGGPVGVHILVPIESVFGSGYVAVWDQVGTSLLNHFTVPCAMRHFFQIRV
jgi:hypothetical protein